VALALLTVFTLVLLFGALIVLPRSIRRLRAVKRDSRRFHEQWKALDSGRRREITKAVRRGDAVTDPGDAALALEAIANAERVFDALIPLELVYTPGLLTLFAYGLMEHDRTLMFVGIAITALAGVTTWFSWRRRRGLRQAAAAIRARGAGQ
jgi:hypothetical protein